MKTLNLHLATIRLLIVAVNYSVISMLSFQDRTHDGYFLKSQNTWGNQLEIFSDGLRNLSICSRHTCGNFDQVMFCSVYFIYIKFFSLSHILV